MIHQQVIDDLELGERAARWLAYGDLDAIELWYIRGLNRERSDRFNRRFA